MLRRTPEGVNGGRRRPEFAVPTSWMRIRTPELIEAGVLAAPRFQVSGWACVDYPARHYGGGDWLRDAGRLWTSAGRELLFSELNELSTPAIQSLTEFAYIFDLKFFITPSFILRRGRLCVLLLPRNRPFPLARSTSSCEEVAG